MALCFFLYSVSGKKPLGIDSSPDS